MFVTRLCLAAGLAATMVSGVAAQQATKPAAKPAAAAPEARIKIDTDRTIGEIDPLLFGNFAEHLGRMIYGGIYEEGSPLADSNGFRKDVLDAVKGLNVSILRWPGGNFASGYNWKDGIGPKDQRPARLELAWNDLETNRFGTDEFLAYSKAINAEPYICINLGLGTIDDARHWVEYTNGTQPTYWVKQRIANGHTSPYNVKYWALGNEIDGSWQLGHKNAEDYSTFALEAAKAMRSVDSSIKLVASGSSSYGPAADWRHWNRTVLENLGHEIDYIALHTYIGNRDNDLEKFLGQSHTIEQYISTTAAQIREVQTRQRTPRPIYIAYDEWNVWYRAYNERKLEETYAAEDALAMGMFFNAFFRHADTVKMANLAQLVNVIAPITTSKTGLFLQPIYFPLVEFSRQAKNVALDAYVSSPTYTFQADTKLPYLYVSVTRNPGTNEVFVNVVNRSKDRAIQTRIEAQDGAWTPSGTVWEMNPTDLKATHTFGDDKKIRPTERSLTAGFSGNGLVYTFPAHSLTILKLKVAKP